MRNLLFLIAMAIAVFWLFGLALGAPSGIHFLLFTAGVVALLGAVTRPRRI